MPAAQLSQERAPNLPAGQTLGAEQAPEAASEKKPEAHAPQLVAPAAANVLAAHGLQR